MSVNHELCYMKFLHSIIFKGHRYLATVLAISVLGLFKCQAQMNSKANIESLRIEESVTAF